MTVAPLPRALEVIVLSLDDARAAEAGGATRLEVVRDIQDDGLTPLVALVETLLAHVRIPLRIMVRPRNRFMLDDPGHHDEVVRDARLYAQLPVDLVTGYVRATPHGATRLDLRALELVSRAAPRARITVHRAVEHVTEALATDLRECPAVDRVLSGGGAGTWSARAHALEQLQASIAPLCLVVGGGVTEDAVEVLVPRSAFRELHVGRLVRVGESYRAPVDERAVATLRRRWLERDPGHV